MYMYVCVYAYVYIHIHIYTHIHKYIYIYILMYIYIYTYIYTYTHIDTHGQDEAQDEAPDGQDKAQDGTGYVDDAAHLGHRGQSIDTEVRSKKTHKNGGFGTKKLWTQRKSGGRRRKRNPSHAKLRFWQEGKNGHFGS